MQVGSAGTRFRLFPQAPFLRPGDPPETVVIAGPPGTIGPGPSDDRLFVIEPIGKKQSFGLTQGPFGTPYLNLPPWRGPIAPPAYPSPDGHFDHIPVDAPEFRQAHLFAGIRFVLEVWENYLGIPVQWHFVRDFDRLEAHIYPPLDNARVGYGFMEAGSHPNDDGSVADYALNFDVIAHEIGHLIIYSLMGVPRGHGAQEDYFGFQESAADSAAMIAVLHFDSMIERLLEDTHGNLYAMNELNRFAELSTNDEIRSSSNSVKMSEFAFGWSDEHDLSQPLTGAIFDILVDVFQETLVDRGVISRQVAEMSDAIRERPDLEPIIQSVFTATYSRRPEAFYDALIWARDYLGAALAETWKRLSAQYLSYDDVGNVLLAIDREFTGGRYHEEIFESFDWREIGTIRTGPRRLAEADETSHALSDRTLTPEMGSRLPQMSYRERYLIADGA